MSQGGPNPEDLSARARRGLLSEAEAGQLERELDRDPVLRTGHAVGVDLDRSTAVRAGDEELVMRAADAALARVASSGLSPQAVSPGASRASGASGFRRGAFPKRRRTAAVLLAAALLLVTGFAAAFWSGVAPMRWLGRSEVLPRALGPASAQPAPAPTISAAPPATAEIGAGAEATAPSRAAEAPAVAPRGQAARAPAETAPALFSAANAARRDGDFERARRAYTELIARYPSSDEARLARVSFGKLLLADGRTSDAEREFDQYLKGGHGQLAEEALVSRAQSLQRLGRADAERLTWQRLLAGYPNSVYAAEARGRLDALRRGGASPAP